MSVIADITQPGLDSFSSVMEFRMRFVDPDLGFPPEEECEFSLPGDETIRRDAASFGKNQEFVIGTQMLSSVHRGPTDFGEVRVTLAPGVQPKGRIWGKFEVDPETEQPTPILPVRSSFEGVQLQFETEQGRFVNRPADVGGVITGIPPCPGDVYVHEVELVMVSADDPNKVVAKGFGRHIIGAPRDPVARKAPLVRECCPPPASIVTEGCLGCIDLDEERRLSRQTIFFAPKELDELDKTLVYVCITNNGPAAMTAVADEGPAFVVLPGQTSNVAAQQSVEVALANVPPLPAHHASGHYVISHCCPTYLGRPKPRRKAKNADKQEKKKKDQKRY